jgi:ZIP family zinc transporter
VASLTGALPVLIPAAAMLAGGGVALRWNPGGATRSGIQHFTAGVVIAAVAAELVPSLHLGQSTWAMAIGFLLGVAAMLAVKKFAGEEGEEAGGAGPIGPFAITIGIDLAVDGLLCGVTLAASTGGGEVVVGALALEVLFLGVATVVSLRNRGLALGKLTALLVGLALLIPIGGFAGYALFGAAPGWLQIAVLAFATAALLYLVFEELLSEAHEDQADTSVTTAMLFLGFLIVLVIKATLD